jgi:hypothetical protein
MKMSNNKRVFAAAIVMAFAALGSAASADDASAEGARQTHDVPSVVGAAYHHARVATNAVEVRRQGGFATAGAVRWTASPDRTSQVAVVDLPSVVGAAYHDQRVATNAVEVRRQGGFGVIGSVRWLPTAPDATVTKVERLTVGAL